MKKTTSLGALLTTYEKATQRWGVAYIAALGVMGAGVLLWAVADVRPTVVLVTGAMIFVVSMAGERMTETPLLSKLDKALLAMMERFRDSFLTKHPEIPEQHVHAFIFVPPDGGGWRVRSYERSGAGPGAGSGAGRVYSPIGFGVIAFGEGAVLYRLTIFDAIEDRVLWDHERSIPVKAIRKVKTSPDASMPMDMAKRGQQFTVDFHLMDGDVERIPMDVGIWRFPGGRTRWKAIATEIRALFDTPGNDRKYS